jgi:hypothetical protein
MKKDAPGVLINFVLLCVSLPPWFRTGARSEPIFCYNSVPPS